MRWMTAVDLLFCTALRLYIDPHPSSCFPFFTEPQRWHNAMDGEGAELRHLDAQGEQNTNILILALHQ